MFSMSVDKSNEGIVLYCIVVYCIVLYLVYKVISVVFCPTDVTLYGGVRFI